MYDYKPVAKATCERDEFVYTSAHANWKGKIKCLHCKATGYGGSVQNNPVWWGQSHGRNCRHKGLDSGQPNACIVTEDTVY